METIDDADYKTRKTLPGHRSKHQMQLHILLYILVVIIMYIAIDPLLKKRKQKFGISAGNIIFKYIFIANRIVKIAFISIYSYWLMSLLISILIPKTLDQSDPSIGDLLSAIHVCNKKKRKRKKIPHHQNSSRI